VAQYIGPAALPFLPQPSRATEVTNVTTMPTAPTTTAVSELFPQVAPTQAPTVPASSSASAAPVADSIYLPIAEKERPRGKFVAACTAVAASAGRVVVRYRLELAPAGLVGTLTGLGWWQHLTGPVGGPTFGFTVLAAAGATVAGYAGLHHKHTALLNGGAGVAIAAGDVAAAVGAGPGAVSLTVSAIGAGLAYAAWTPWLIQHRKDHKQLAPAATTAVVTNGPVPVTTNTVIPAPLLSGVTVHEDEFEAEAAALRAANSPFHHDVIPYADDDSDDIRDPIRIGWDEHGNPVDLTVLYRHTLIAGASDWGKSGLANLLIKKLLKKRNVEIYGIDLKPGAPELGPWAPKLKKLARTPEEARELLKEFMADGEERGRQLEEMSLASLSRGGPAIRKWIPGNPYDPDPARRGHGTAKFLVTDELGELIRQDIELRKQEADERRADPDNASLTERPVASLYESGLAVLRFLAMQYISLTQQPSGRVFGDSTDARGNYVNRCCTRVSDPEHAQYMFGKSWKSRGFDPSVLNRPGEIFIACPEMPDVNPPRVRVMYVNDMDIAADVAHLHSGFRPKEPIGQFAPQSEQRPLIRMVKAPQQMFPDGAPVGRDDWPDLYRVFCNLCEQQGSATKEELTEAGPFASRDTARRALDAWLEHGVQVRKAGRAEQFFLPDSADSDD